MSSYYSIEELESLGLKAFGKDVLISRKCSIYGAGNMVLGDHVRIDDFCILSGNITIGNYVHLAAGVYLYGGKAGIEFDDYSTISSRSAIYAQSDDFSGHYMTNPTIPAEYTSVQQGKVYVGKHCIIGTGSTVLPGVHFAEGCSAGAMSFINKSTEPWGIYVGIPVRRIKERSRELLKYCQELESK